MIPRTVQRAGYGLLLLTLWLGLARGKCRHDADCAEHSTFCRPMYCDAQSGTCLGGVEPCAGVCLEDESRCVECLSNDDCRYGLVCSPSAHTCVPCVRDSECRKTDWCHGGHEVCDRTHHRCRDPVDLPCPDAERCISEWKECFPCRKDVDCGVFDFCDSPQAYCNATTGQCIVGPSRCEQDGLFCDATSQKCVECRNTADCTANAPARPFCSSPLTCSGDGICRQDEARPTPCLASETCDERRKRCLPASDQAPGHDTAGASSPPAQPKGLGAPCRIPEDCQPFGLICRIISPSDADARECRQCHTHAQCADGNPYNGDELCDQETGMCFPPETTTDDTTLDTAHHRLPEKNVPGPRPAGVAGGQPPHLFRLRDTASAQSATTTTTTNERDSYVLLGVVIGFLTILIVGGLIYYFVAVKRRRTRRRKRY